MRKIVLLGLFFSLFVSQNTAKGEYSYPQTEFSIYSQSDIVAAYNEIKSKNINAVVLDKNQKFAVKSTEAITYRSPIGMEVVFNVPRTIQIFPGHNPSTVKFIGKIVENKPPRLLGRSGTLKLKIYNMNVDKVKYPINAYITKIGKHNIAAGTLSMPGVYLNNVANTADRGTISINKIYKDPCTYNCSSVTPLARPLYYIGGAFLQVADLAAAPIISIFSRGNNLNIPKDTDFEIKLNDNVSLLEF